MTTAYRQGDVMLLRLEGLPAGATKEKGQGDVILARGEATGHAHRIAAGTATPYQWQGNRLIEVSAKGASLTHEEHATIPIAPGVFKVIQQLQYTPEAIRPAYD